MIETVLMFLIFVSLFIREVNKEKKDFIELKKRDNEKILNDIEQFLNSKRTVKDFK